MKQLQRDEISDFLERFDQFRDGVLREIHVIMREQKSVELIIEVMDCHRNRDWIELRMRIDNVTRFQWRETWQDLNDGVISLPLLVTYLDNQFHVGVNLFGNGDLYMTTEQIEREATLSVTGDIILYSIAPLTTASSEKNS